MTTREAIRRALSLLFLLGGLNNNLAEVPQLCQPAGGLVSAQSRSGDNVHEFGALQHERLERGHLLKIAGGVGELLGEFRARLELGEGNLQSQLTEMPALLRCQLPHVPALLQAGRAGGDKQGSTDTEDGADQAENAANNRRADADIHLLALFLAGGGIAMIGFLFGIGITLKIIGANFNPDDSNRNP